jgi:two-component system, response regulator
MTNNTILLVEDTEDDIELTLRALKINHIANEVAVARDGAEALARIFDRATGEPVPVHELPAVVLLDLKLPKIGGLEVLRAIRAHPVTRNLPVVVLTSSREDPDVAASYSLGANSYVRKPVDFKEFTDAIRHLGLYWLVLNIPPFGH